VTAVRHVTIETQRLSIHFGVDDAVGPFFLVRRGGRECLFLSRTMVTRTFGWDDDLPRAFVDAVDALVGVHGYVRQHDVAVPVLTADAVCSLLRHLDVRGCSLLCQQVYR